MPSFREFDLVRVRGSVPPEACSYPDVPVEAGTVGTVVRVYPDEAAYDVEFAGRHPNVCRLHAAQLELITITEVD